MGEASAQNLEPIVLMLRQALDTRNADQIQEAGSSLRQICRDIDNFQDPKSIPSLAKILVRIEVPKAIHDYLKHLQILSSSEAFDKWTKHVRYSQQVLYGFLRVLTNDPDTTQFKIALIESDVTMIIAECLVSVAGYYQQNQVLDKIVDHGLTTVYNCTDAADSRPRLKEQVFKAALLYTDPYINDISRICPAVMIVNLICPDNSINTYLYPDSVFKDISGLFGTVVKDAAFNKHMVKYPPSFTKPGPLKDVLYFLSILAPNEAYRCRMTRMFEVKEAVLDSLLTNGDKWEKNSLCFTVELLTRHQCNRCSRDYAVRLLTKHSDVPIEAPIDPVAPVHSTCPEMQQCTTFFSKLDISEMYLQPEQNRCFCAKCMRQRGDKEMYWRGEPKKVYALPKGWAKFAIRMPARKDVYPVFEKWHVAFFGTTVRDINAIIESGNLASTHTDDLSHNRFSSLVDQRPVILTPSAIYALNDVLTLPEKIVDEKTPKKRPRIAKVMMQVRIDPRHYQERPAQHATRATVDPHYKNAELEWTTSFSKEVILTGIFVKISG